MSDTKKIPSAAQLKQVCHVMEHFDFVKVNRVMTLLEWKWRDLGVPDVDELRKQALALLEEVACSDAKFSLRSTGGFVATKDSSVLELSFQIEGWECVDEEIIQECQNELEYVKIEKQIDNLKELKAEWNKNANSLY